MTKKTLSKLLLFSTVILGSVGLVGCSSSSESESSEVSTSSEKTNSSTTEGDSQTSTDNTSASSASSSTEEQSAEETYYTVTFNVDSNVKVYVYETQDMTLEGTESTVAYSRDGDTGELLGDGTGQINFKLVFVDGYEVDNISITGTYNKLKGSADTGVENGYRITKVQSDLEVTITSKSSDAEEDIVESDYKATFTTEHCSVYVYETQDTTGDGTLATEAYARDSATGNILSDGTGQINFRVVCDEGYTVSASNITITGTYNNLKVVSEGYYRITKISSDLTVNIEAIASSTVADTLTSVSIESTYSSQTLTLNVNATSEFSYTYTDNLLTINTELENEITLDGSYYGAIVVNSYSDVCVSLNGVTLRSDTVCPLYISTTGDAEISAKKNTTNYVYDDRAYVDTEDTT
ncbi:MAG: carbohydrate-binding domain-containing protein, partial [Acholeplasmatales bacterium]|nr:carbohydrate-binding domain-containing protein [Acholeplasmatales bacterium]